MTRHIRSVTPRLVLVVLVAAVVVLSQADGGNAGAAFNSTSGLTLSSHTLSAAADTTIRMDVPKSEYFPYMSMYTVPSAAFVAPGPGHGSFNSSSHPALGSIVGTVSATTNFGFTNTPCAAGVTVAFPLINATVSTSTTITPLSQSSAGPAGILENLWTDTGGGAPSNGLPAQVDRYPSFLNIILEPDGASAVQPLARYAGATMIGGTVLTINLVVFSNNDLRNAFSANSSPALFMDLADLGYTIVAVYNDPTQPGSAVSVTDQCSPLSATFTLFGSSRNNPCNGTTTGECSTASGINAPTIGTTTTQHRYTNPATSGTHLWYLIHQSHRDLDSDGQENALDTCPLTSDSLNSRLPFGDPANDADLDRIAGACDTVVNGANSDQDNDGWLNAADNCPLVPNGTQAESEGGGQLYRTATPRGGPKTDAIGDACDGPETGTQCDNATDDDADTLVNDGCPAVGAAEIGCLNKADDDGDGKVNDGCPSSARVANGHFHTTINLIPKCIGATDSDGDGYCNADETTLGSTTTNANSTPEHYSLVRIFPVTHSGSGSNPGASREPKQVCNDGIDNDLDGFVDLLEPDGPDTGSLGDCNPQDYTRAPFGSSIPATDTDGDGATDFEEIFVGTDALGRCEVGSTTVPSGDWPYDLAASGASTDRIQLLDISSYVSPVSRLNTSPGHPNYNPRWDVNAGTTTGAWIGLLDLSTIITRQAAMFGGGNVWNGPACTAHPTFGD